MAVAEIVADFADVETAVVTVKVADVAPAETVTDPGTETPTVLLDNETDSPPVGAGPTRVTVPVAFCPPTTSDGAIPTDAGTVRWIVNTSDLVEPLAAADIVDSESVLTALVVTVKDAED